MWSIRDADFLLVQNPPSIPTLGVSRLFVLFLSRRTKLIIDWHNLGYSILSLKLDKKVENGTGSKQLEFDEKNGDNNNGLASFKDPNDFDESNDSNNADDFEDVKDPLLGKHHLFVTLYKWYEGFFGKHAFCHFTVTVRMGQVIRRRFKMSGRRILPLYDRPALDFHPLTAEERETVIKAHSQKGNIFEDWKANGTEEEKVIITSTSYTPDEDIYMLLNAVEKYDAYKSVMTSQNDAPLNKSKLSSANSQTSKLPNLRVIITGKGPMLSEIKEYISNTLAPKLKHTRIYTAWLSTEDYPLVLGTADVGVSLHMSSSGVDLPMKAVDMFGCGVPVISVLYPALPELVKNNKNGLYIKTDEDLFKALRKLFVQDTKLYNTIKQGAIRESRIKWDHEWNKKVGPLFGIGKYRQREAGEESDSSSSSDDGF